jgi:hypothetical protein
MAIGAIWSPPIDKETYDAVKERVLQASLDAGLRFHAAGESPEGWRIIDPRGAHRGAAAARDVPRAATDSRTRSATSSRALSERAELPGRAVAMRDERSSSAAR